jgi:hypothetical protein
MRVSDLVGLAPESLHLFRKNIHFRRRNAVRIREQSRSRILPSSDGRGGESVEKRELLGDRKDWHRGLVAWASRRIHLCINPIDNRSEPSSVFGTDNIAFLPQTKVQG